MIVDPIDLYFIYKKRSERILVASLVRPGKQSHWC